MLMGKRIGYKDVLSMIKVSHNEVKIQFGGWIFVEKIDFYCLTEQLFKSLLNFTRTSKTPLSSISLERKIIKVALHFYLFRTCGISISLSHFMC